MKYTNQNLNLRIWVAGVCAVNKKYSVYHKYSLNDKSILLRTIQFTIGTQFKCQNSSIK